MLKSSNMEENNASGNCSDVEDFMTDNYHHVSPDIFYTSTSIPGPGANIEEFNTQFMGGCACEGGKCNIENNCPCVAKYGMNYDKSGTLLDSKFSGPVVECNSMCGCVSQGRCGNRLIQFGPRDGLQVFEAGHGKGFGLKSETEILKGEFICEYAGEILSMVEAKCRAQANVGKMNYIFVLNEYLSQGHVLKTYVDPTMIGNIGRYVNHSCQPNAAVVPIRTDNPVPKLCIFALKVICIGEEITFDYGGGNSDGGCPMPAGPTERRSCYCEAESCKQFLPYDKTLF
jgi:histone-lysine N-methyltransferase SETMAR